MCWLLQSCGLAGCFSGLPWANSHTRSGLYVGLEPSSELGRLKELGLALLVHCHYPRDVTGLLQKGRHVQRQRRQKLQSFLRSQGGRHTTFCFYFYHTLLVKASHKENHTQRCRRKAHVLMTEGNITLQVGGILGREESEPSRGYRLATNYSYSYRPQNMLFPPQPKSYLIETVFSLGSQDFVPSLQTDKAALGPGTHKLKHKLSDITHTTR